MEALRELYRRLAPLLWSCLVLWIAVGYLLSRLSIADDLASFNALRGTWTDGLFIYGTLLGEAYGYVLAFLLLLLWQRRDAIWIGWTALAVAVVSQIAKWLFREPRPGAYADEAWFRDGVTLVEGVRPLTGMTSFPSGHTMAAFALVTILVYLLPSRKRWWLPLWLLAVAVGISRMYLVMHFLKDVLLGSILGVAVAGGVALLHRRQASAGVSSAESSS